SGWVAPDPHLLIPIVERTNFTGAISIRCGIELDDADVEAAQTALRKLDGYRLSQLQRSVIISDVYHYKDSRFDKRTSHWAGLEGTGRTKKGRIDRSLTYAEDEPRWQQLALELRKRLPTIWYFPHFLFDFP